KDRARRPGSAAELRRALLGVTGLAGASVPLAELVQNVPADAHDGDDRAMTVTIPHRLSPKARRRRLWRRIAVSLMAATLVAGGGIAAWAYVIPHYTHVPSVTGLTQDAAGRRIPSAGQRIPFGSKVTITVSDGKQPVKVPGVVGQSSADAQALLQARGFKVITASKYSVDVPIGGVIRETPAGGKVVPVGTTVHLVVSLGPKTFSMPNVVNLSAATATADLEKLGLHVRQVRIPNSTGNSVVGQNPGRG